MKFVATKTADQLDPQAPHRVRERVVSQRTGIINQIRAFLLERGIAVRQGLRFLRAQLGHPVRFELSEQTREAVDDYIWSAPRRASEFLFPSRRHADGCLTTRHYSRLISTWIAGIDLDPALYGTHSLRRTKATLIYRRTGNLRAVQLLLGHRRIESTVRYLGIEVDDALALAGQVEV
jgi:site-specific recombinase XerD